MIEITALSKAYGSFTAVRDLSFSVQPGEVLGLVGPNDAGKTTTLRTMAGIIPPTSGAVRIGGHDIANEPIEAKRLLAFFPDEPRLFDYLTVRQHLTFVARLYGVAKHEALAQPLLEELEIADRADQLPGELSRGMKQKVSIACGLLHSPTVMIFDEPLTGLDPLGIRRMKDSILQRARAGAAVVLSSHLLHLLEEVCSHVLILKKGERLAYDTLARVHAQFSGGDPRTDLPNTDILKTYPLHGWQVVLGELLTPLATLSTIIWFLLLAEFLVFPANRLTRFDPALRGAAALSGAAIAPPLIAIQLLVLNAAVLIFPAWTPSVVNRAERGFEVLGQRIIFVAGLFLITTMALTPAALGATFIFLVAKWLVGTYAAITLVAIAVVLILSVETWLGILWLGDRFERFDMSAELRPSR